MDFLIILLALVGGLTAGPFVVAKVWPGRSSVTGDATAGESGASPVLWGVPLGLSVFVAVISGLILAGPEVAGNQATRFEIAAALFGLLGLVSTPLVICGLHTWRWDSDGLEFVGVFRRQSVLWKEIASVRRLKGMGWTLRTVAGAKLSMSSGYLPGEPFIIAALSENRPEFASSITAALEEEYKSAIK
ncbi:hypothetical protein [Hyphomonas sp.]|jgi:hypothetical protein|uniref:hypothetical protein n=1 Tax=Hyphomonas sp. TaxID=87 RepID=UPI0025C0DB04|nr:hypothetical protein [Hyphomonas sp.]